MHDRARCQRLQRAPRWIPHETIGPDSCLAPWHSDVVRWAPPCLVRQGTLKAGKKTTQMHTQTSHAVPAARRGRCLCSDGLCGRHLCLVRRTHRGWALQPQSQRRSQLFDVSRSRHQPQLPRELTAKSRHCCCTRQWMSAAAAATAQKMLPENLHVAPVRAIRRNRCTRWTPQMQTQSTAQRCRCHRGPSIVARVVATVAVTVGTLVCYYCPCDAQHCRRKG